MPITSSTDHVICRLHITQSGAQLVIAHAQEQARQQGLNISVAVVDRTGEIVAFARDDDTAPVTPQVALAKARTAALLRAPSKVFEDFINGGLPSFLATPGVTPLQGGIPLTSGGEVIGAVGVSGGSGEQDAAIAASAAAALKQA